MTNAPASPSRTLDPARLLYAEDCESNVMLFELYLKHTPFIMEAAENGLQALEKFRDGDFDLVIMDFQMPVMGGGEAIRAIRGLEAETGRERTPIVALTAYPSKKNEAEAVEAGCDLFLTKPLRKVQLIELIQELGAARRKAKLAGGQAARTA